MLRRRSFAVIATALMLALFVAGLIHLVQLRYEHGDVYPVYSSLRSDPLGAKVLYEALDELPGCESSRNLRPLSRLAPAPPATVYLLGVQEHFQSTEAVQKLAQSGARVVLTLRAEKAETPTPTPTPTPSASPSPTASPSPSETPEETFSDVFGITIKATKSKPVASSAQPGLPPRIAWHSDAYFADLGSAWRVIYRCENRPVIIERSYGSGSLVVASDSYLLSNEAMLNDREPALLAWLNGAGAHVIFDETHLDVLEHEGIATLVRKYRLLGLVAALAVFLALAAWQQSASLVPPWRELHEEQEQILVGRDARAGFISLLRRSVPPRELLATCLAEWKRSHERSLHPARQKKLEAALADAATRPLATYQALHQILSEKTR